MSGEPRVSVVVPVYNRAELVGGAIESVLAQSFRDWELILVDDASDDDPAAILAGYRDARLRSVRRAVNGGVSAAQNTGLDAARGRLVAFLHSDDRWHPERLQRMVPALETAPADVGAAESGFELLDPGSAVRRGPFLAGATGADVLAYRAHVHVSTLLFRTQALRSVRFDDMIRRTEDRDLTARFLPRYRLVFLPEVLVTIDRRNQGLRQGDHTPHYEYIAAKHRAVVARDPATDALWQLRIVAEAARLGNAATGRRAARRLARIRPGRLSWWPLRAAARLPESGPGDALFLSVVRARHWIAGHHVTRGVRSRLRRRRAARR